MHNSWAMKWIHVACWIYVVFLWISDIVDFITFVNMESFVGEPSSQQAQFWGQALTLLTLWGFSNISILMRHSCISFYIKSISILNLLLLCLHQSHRSWIKEKLTWKQKLIFCNAFYSLPSITPKVIYQVV